MRINELINELKQVEEEHGNLEIRLCRHHYGDVESVQKDEFFDALVKYNNLIV